MLHQVSTSALANLGEEEKVRELEALVQHTEEVNGSASAYLKSRIRAFELRYEMSSEELMDALATGRQKETADISEWLFLLDALEAHGR